jgi:glycosyltransferase involved in cell wall biosynthesis
MIAFVLLEIVRTFPRLLKSRKHLKNLRDHSRKSEPSVAWLSSNLDEVNGIALASRRQLKVLKEKGMDVFLLGVAFHGKPSRREAPYDSTLLFPGRFSCDQAGYKHSELAVIRLDCLIEFLQNHSIDLMEFESPGPVEMLGLWTAKWLGIRTASHYRTDIIDYSAQLVSWNVGVLFIQGWTRMFTRLAGPVIVPSETYREKVKAMGVPSLKITKLPRGVDLENFNPGARDPHFWKSFGYQDDGLRLVYVGRISREKNLEVLITAFRKGIETGQDWRLFVIGDGPFRREMETVLTPLGRAHFTGFLSGEALKAAYANSDLLVFPSLTDTFGNSVLEALASGIPCVVSDQGGPPEIILDPDCGRIFKQSDSDGFYRALVSLSSEPELRTTLRLASRKRAETFTYENSSMAFWNYYRGLLGYPTPNPNPLEPTCSSTVSISG